MNEYTYVDFDEVLKLFRTSKGFTTIEYTKDGMVILSGKDYGWMMMNANEFDKIMEEKVMEYLKNENKD